MTDYSELITRLRALELTPALSYYSEDLRAAADALEAAQAEKLAQDIVDTATIAVLLDDLAEARAERDAEAALADRLADALGTERDIHQCKSAFTAAELDAHRERRTTPTKDGNQ